VSDELAERAPCGRNTGDGEVCDYERAEYAEACGFHLSGDLRKARERVRELTAEVTGTRQVSAVMLDALGGTFTFTDAALREVDGTMYRYEQPDRLGWTVSRDPGLRP
jgi:hypothetical protein